MTTIAPGGSLPLDLGEIDSPRESVRFLQELTPAYESFTFPAYRGLILPPLGSPRVVAIGLELNGTPAGLALSQQEAAGRARILSIFVDRLYRRSGWAGQLLRRSEQEWRTRGARELHLSYSESSTGAPALARLLKAQGWSAPAPSMLLAQVGNKVLSAPWYHRPLPPGYSVFPWRELSAANRARLEADADAGLLSRDELWPFAYEEGQEPLTSLGLRCRGELAGWLITHRVGPKTIRYTAQFVRREYQTGQVGLALVAAAVRRQVAELGEDSLGTFGIIASRERLIRVFHRQMAPYCQSFAYTLASRKELT